MDTPTLRQLAVLTPSLKSIVAIAVAVTLGGLGIAACGSSGSTTTTTTATPLSGLAAQPPATILADACADTLSAHSVVANTTYKVPSQVGGATSMHWILTVGANQGAVTYQNRGIVHAVIMPVISYLNGDAKYWSLDASPPRPTTASQLSNKWLSVASSSANNTVMAALISQASLQGLLANCVPSATPTRGHIGLVGSTPSVSLVVASASTTQTFFVATSGTPHIIKSTITGAASGDETTMLSGFNSQKPVKAPVVSTPSDPLIAS